MTALTQGRKQSTGETILVVDDLSLMRERTRLGLVFAGYRVIEACDGREAVDVYMSQRPDAVFMDTTMPVMSGSEALTEIISSRLAC